MDESLGLTEKLIREVRMRQALWNYKSVYYHNRIVINTLWQEVSDTLKISKETAKLKWKGLRDTYRRELRKHRSRCSEQRVPFPGVLEPTWIHYQNMSFLKEYIKDTILDPTVPNWNDLINQTEDDDKTPTEPLKEGKNSESSNGNGFIDQELTSKEIPLRIDYEYENGDEDPLILEDIGIKQEILQNAKETNSDVSDSLMQDYDRKRKYSCCDNYYNKRRRISNSHCNFDDHEDEKDDDLLYFKSLLPYIKSLTPIRKLFVRSEIQNLILKEMQNEERSNLIPLEHVTTNMGQS